MPKQYLIYFPHLRFSLNRKSLVFQKNKLYSVQQSHKEPGPGLLRPVMLAFSGAVSIIHQNSLGAYIMSFSSCGASFKMRRSLTRTKKVHLFTKTLMYYKLLNFAWKLSPCHRKRVERQNKLKLSNHSTRMMRSILQCKQMQLQQD